MVTSSPTIMWISDPVHEERSSGLVVIGRNFHNGRDYYRYHELDDGRISLVTNFFGENSYGVYKNKRAAGVAATSLYRKTERRHTGKNVVVVKRCDRRLRKGVAIVAGARQSAGRGHVQSGRQSAVDGSVGPSDASGAARGEEVDRRTVVTSSGLKVE